jgi:hypothetical protein
MASQKTDQEKERDWRKRFASVPSLCFEATIRNARRRANALMSC